MYQQHDFISLNFFFLRWRFGITFVSNENDPEKEKLTLSQKGYLNMEVLEEEIKNAMVEETGQ